MTCHNTDIITLQIRRKVDVANGRYCDVMSGQNARRHAPLSFHVFLKIFNLSVREDQDSL